MIPLAEVPRSGMLMLIVRFDGYKDNYQNDTRIRFIKIPGWINKAEIPLQLEPISFSLIKSVTQEGLSRASGAIQIYSFVGLKPEIYKQFHSKMAEFCKELNWWKSWDLLIAQKVNLEE